MLEKSGFPLKIRQKKRKLWKEILETDLPGKNWGKRLFYEGNINIMEIEKAIKRWINKIMSCI